MNLNVTALALLLLAGCVSHLPVSETTLYDGTYDGVAEPSDPNLPGCGNPFRVDNFVVKDGDVAFGGLRGPIANDRSFRADDRRNAIDGGFAGAQFTGRMTLGPLCVMNMRLNRRG